MGAIIQPQPPPHSIDAEQMVLGSLLLDPETWPAIADQLKPTDFYRIDHQLIYQEMGILVGEGTPCDILLLSEQLERNGKLEAAGGLAYLSSLRRDTTTAANVRYYADIVLERARLRRLQSIGPDIEHAIEGSATASQIARGLMPVLDAFAETAGERTKRRPLDWSALTGQTPPEREWAIPHWLGLGHVTLISGGGGTGKTGLAQAAGSCIALRREYLDWIPAARSVLVWACEDDDNELWRRQLAIAEWLNVPLSEFDGKLHLISYDGEDVELAGLLDQRRLIESPMMATLRDQIGDYKAEVVFLDNIGRLYGGSENDRHQVTTFVAMLNAAARSTQAAIGLLGHPAKAVGSEYSGSTAWEGAVRGRLYLGRTLPDDESKKDDEPTIGDDTVRYLSRRKANYSNRDWRRIHYRDGVMVPEAAPDVTAAIIRPGVEYARDVVGRAVRKLSEIGEHGVASTSSSKYLPRLAKDYRLLDRLSEKEFTAAMRAMRTEGRLMMAVVGKYSNRNPREGLVLAETHEAHK